MKITNKKRFILSLLILLVIIFSAFNFCLAENKEIMIEEYSVQAGDTLWSIATEYKNRNQDIREYIYNLQELNNIDCIIYPGQIIKIIK